MDRILIGEQLRRCLGEYQEQYPAELVANYPRIANTIVDLWGSRNLDKYFEDLLIDDRGDRQGFPPSVVHELMGLMRAYDWQRNIKPSSTPDIWGHAEEPHLEFRKAEPLYTSLTLIEAAQKGEKDRIMTMVKAGISSDRTDDLGKSALIWAASYGHTDVVDYLLTLKTDINRADLGGFRALHWAATNGHLAVVNTLIEHGANLDVQNKRGLTPLMLAAQNLKQAVVSRLLQAGANPNIEDEEGSNILHQLLLYGRSREALPILTLLLEYQADVGRRNRQHQSPLEIAMQHDDAQIRTLFSHLG
ncbi:Ankyrin repeat-containing protein [Andreprevotia lacus DSM 23236]|jgi:ankyrin repeat protein|uniref:Ankyrin repeat-containing protein n=1 Tax=Andreprevotia lacus DSM 23236 TaxID=1121001 RepID=A0A1W1XXD7_9NEIS|nr:ankyrin repeat domain-containing protein [Andreprevotia lacus]SMC28517.1 Ankyrin repeat-containing protein [Andreprevotia lacus DSM 23236]